MGWGRGHPERQNTKRGGIYIGPDQLYCSVNSVIRGQGTHNPLVNQ